MHRTVTVLLATLGLLLGVAFSAQAHEVVIYNGNDWAHMNSGHGAAQIHDEEHDGNAVYVVARFHMGGTVWVSSNWDHNGSDPGGDQITAPDGHPFYEFRTCERATGGSIMGDPCDGSGNAWHDA